MIFEFFGSVVVAAFSSLIGAFAGGGSSLLMFPLLGELLTGTYAQHLAITKASAAVLCSTSGKIHIGKNKISKKLLGTLTGFGLVGTAIGTYLVQYQLNETLFKGILATVLLCVAIYLLFTKKIGINNQKVREISWQSLVIVAGFSTVLSILNGLFGGTGIFTSIFLVLFFRFTFIQAAAYTMASYALINIIQSGYLIFTEKPPFVLVVAVIGGSFLGAYFGTKFQYLKGNLWVKRASIAIMFLMAARIFMQLF